MILIILILEINKNIQKNVLVNLFNNFLEKVEDNNNNNNNNEEELNLFDIEQAQEADFFNDILSDP